MAVGPKDPKDKRDDAPHEAMLELVQLADGELVLRPINSESEPLVTIRFGEQVRAMVGDQLPLIGQQMIQAAVHAYVEQQAARWQANVID